jgi:SAM-dependent methyltransferase
MTARPYFASYYRWLVASRRLGVDLSGPRVLDVGTDDANFLGRSRAGLRVGVDLAPRARPQPGIELLRADARRLPLLGGSFDTILAFDVLEHIEDDRAVMREMLRVLAPGGALWLSTPARDTRFWPRFIHPYANYAFGHVRNGYTPGQLRGLLPRGGEWRMDLFFWDEPLLRAAFVPLHLLDRLAAPLADRLTRWCFALDSRRADGRRGHLFGCVRRAADGPPARGDRGQVDGLKVGQASRTPPPIPLPASGKREKSLRTAAAAKLPQQYAGPILPSPKMGAAGRGMRVDNISHAEAAGGTEC